MNASLNRPFRSCACRRWFAHSRRSSTAFQEFSRMRRMFSKKKFHSARFIKDFSVWISAWISFKHRRRVRTSSINFSLSDRSTSKWMFELSLFLLEFIPGRSSSFKTSVRFTFPQMRLNKHLLLSPLLIPLFVVWFHKLSNMSQRWMSSSTVCNDDAESHWDRWLTRSHHRNPLWQLISLWVNQLDEVLFRLQWRFPFALNIRLSFLQHLYSLHQFIVNIIHIDLFHSLWFHLEEKKR